MEIELSHSQFFGRSRTLSLLRKRVRDLKDGYRQNVALLGQQHIGKSRLLAEFVYNLDDTDVIVIFLDLQNRDFNYFFHKFTCSLLFHYAKATTLPIYEDLPTLIEITKEHIPHTIQVIKKIQTALNGHKYYDVFLGLMTLPEVFTNETGKFCVLILDEFQSLEDFMFDNVYQELGKKIMTQKKCFYVFSSSYPNQAKKVLTEKMSLLFGNFELIPVEAFQSETACQFVEYQLRPVKITPELIRFIVDFTGGHPLYLNLICQEMKTLAHVHHQEEIFLPIVTQAVENLLFNCWGALSRHFDLVLNELCSGRGNRIMSRILTAITENLHRPDEMMRSLSIKRSQLNQKLSKLIDHGIIVKNGCYHNLTDKLFRYWLKYVYQRRLNDLELIPDKQVRLFRESFHTHVEHFQNTNSKSLSSRIAELLHCFEDDQLSLNGRRYRLPLFREVVPSQIRFSKDQPLDVIRAEGDGYRWLVVIHDDVSDCDLSAIVHETKKQGYKIDRYVLISLSTLDGDVRVKALQEKFWYWSKGELNSLLRLYNKPDILMPYSHAI